MAQITTNAVNWGLNATLTVNQGYQNIAENYTDLNWEVSVGSTGGGTPSTNYKQNFLKAYINGELVKTRGGGLYTKGNRWSGTHRVYHNADGSKNVKLFIEARFPSYCSANGDMWLTSIPRKATFSWTGGVIDTTDHIYFSYNNPAGNAVDSLQFTARIDDDPKKALEWRDVPKTGSEYKYILSSKDIDFLRSKLGNAKSKKLVYCLKTRIGGKDNYDYRNTKFSVTNASAPVFTKNSIDVTESNKTVSNLSLKTNNFVQKQSKLQIVIPTANGKNTDIKKYIVKLNNKTLNTYTSSGTKTLQSIDFAGKAKLKVIAEDGRGLQKEISKDVTFIEWNKPSAAINVKRVNNYEDDTKLKVNANFSSVSGKNTLEIFYKKKKVNSSYYSDKVKITNNQEATIFNDKQYAWDVVVILKDKFIEVEYPINVPLGKFIFFIDTKKLSVGINCFPKGKETLEVSGKRVLTEDDQYFEINKAKETKPKKGYNLYPYIYGYKITTKKTLWSNNTGIDLVNSDKSDKWLTGMPNLNGYISADGKYLIHLFISYGEDGTQVGTICLTNAGPHWVTYVRDFDGGNKDMLFLTLGFSNLNSTKWKCRLGGNISIGSNKAIENNNVFARYKLKKVIVEKL